MAHHTARPLLAALAALASTLAACADAPTAPARAAAPRPAPALAAAFAGWFSATPYERVLLPGLAGLADHHHATGATVEGAVVGHMNWGVPVVWRSSGDVEMIPVRPELVSAGVLGLGEDDLVFGEGRDAEGNTRAVVGRPSAPNVGAIPLRIAGPPGSRAYDGGAGWAAGTQFRNGDWHPAYFLIDGGGGTGFPLDEPGEYRSLNRIGNAAGWYRTSTGRRAIVGVRQPYLCDPSVGCAVPPAWTAACANGPTIGVCELPRLHAGAEEAGATGINDRREVAGWVIIGDGRMRAFRWTPWSGMQDLETPTGMFTADLVQATAISDDGRIVGTLVDKGRSYGWVWSRGRPMRVIGEGMLPDAIHGDHVVGHTAAVFTGSTTYPSKAFTLRLPPYVDRDHDGIEDEFDNCPALSNVEQRDADGDGIGDGCDATFSLRASLVQVAPSPVSLAQTALVNVVLLGSRHPVAFDAARVDAAALRLRVTAGGPAVAPATRGTAVVTSLGDVNGDGVADRLVSFRTVDLKAAGLAASRAALLFQGSYAGAPLEGTTPLVTVQP